MIIAHFKSFCSYVSLARRGTLPLKNNGQQLSVRYNLSLMNHSERESRVIEFVRRLSEVAELSEKAQRGLRWRLTHYLFPNVDFTGKRFLDIGGGTGTYTFYAAFMGAEQAICLEPEAAGSSEGMQHTFRKRAELLGLKNVHLLPITFQEYEAEKPFDILFSHNAINHLDEEAVIRCHRDAAAQAIYLELFRKMRAMCVAGGELIVADASRHSFWSVLGVRSPITPTIEWHKHQPPHVWSQLLEQAGFRVVSVRWRSPASLGRLGQVVIGNAWVNYFLWSQFCMTLRAV